MADPKGDRVRAPLMSAFRTAFEKRDAKESVDLRDEGGERVLAGRRANGRGAVSEALLQRVVAQDIEMLMNTVHLAATLDLSAHPAARGSILNFGFPDVVHRTIEEITVDEIAGEIETALRVFEPRLTPGSIAVRRDHSVDELLLKIRFVVRADLDLDPLNVPVEFVADLDRDTGKMTINRR